MYELKFKMISKLINLINDTEFERQPWGRTVKQRWTYNTNDKWIQMGEPDSGNKYNRCVSLCHPTYLQITYLHICIFW